MKAKEAFVPYQVPLQEDEQLIENSKHFFSSMNSRRSVRDISSKSVPKEVIENVIKTASTAPSGAHMQPWSFVVITNKDLKKKIRLAAEEEERKSYQGRMSEQWLKDLAPLGTDDNKPFIEEAPYIIIVFKQTYRIDANGNKLPNYYVSESVGIATGLLISAIHQAGLVCLTHTPSPMNFLIQLLDRPQNEKPFVLIPVGWPKKDCKVPNLNRKALNEILHWRE